MRASSRFVRRLAADRRGNLMIEFALVLPILTLLLVGLLDLGRFSLDKSAMLQGAREGAQYGIIAPDDSTNINTTAQNATGLSGVTATNSVFCECPAAPGTAVTCSGATPCAAGATRKKYVTVNTTRAFTSVLGPATTTFGLNGTQGWIGAWTPPTSTSASVTMIVPP
jgi:Flp pilus assembly protein TadG